MRDRVDEKMQVNGIPYEQWKQQPKAKPKFEFLPEVWDEIKEFAGVYGIGKEWPTVSKLSWPKMCAFYKSIGVTDANAVRKKLHGLRKYKTRKVWEQLYEFGSGSKAKKDKDEPTVSLSRGVRRGRPRVYDPEERQLARLHHHEDHRGHHLHDNGTFRLTTLRYIEMR
jgi:hypothetical protein